MTSDTIHRLTPRQLALAAALCCAGGLVGGTALAQDKAADPATLERITVTGSNIRQLDLETALPLQVISAEDIRRSGKTSVTEVLQSLSASGPNGLTDSGSFSSFAYGASGVSLRGLGPTATLILINSRRVVPYSVPDINNGLTNFVNVDAIPLAAIKRVEVLKDGASAIYGSDAMAGVINIILRDDYQGAVVEANARRSTEGGFGTQWAGVTAGRGDLQRDGWNWLAAVDVFHRDQVMLRDVADNVIDPRHRDSSFYYTGRPGNNRFTPTPNYYSGVSVDPASGASFVSTRTGHASPNCPADQRWAFNGNFTPALNLCGYSYWDDAAQYVSPQQRQSLFSRGEMLLSSGVSVFGELALSRLTNRQRDWPTPFGAGLGATPDGRDGGVAYVPQFLPAGHPNNPFPNQPAGITYLFSDVGMQGTDVTNNTGRVLVGARGSIHDWNWETALMHAQDTTEVSYRNRVSLPVLRDAVLAGTYNFEQPSAGPVTADQLRINPIDHGRASFTLVDAKLSGEFGQLPGGPIGFAAGLEARHEQRAYHPDDRIYSGEVYLQVAGRTDGSRNVMSAFSELSLPLTKTLQAQLALRGDHYSDYGSSVTPKVALAWAPVSSVKLRGSVSQGFRAPSLNEAASSDTPLFSGVGFDPKRCGQFNIDCDGYNNSGVVQANHNLKPERSTAYGLGLVVEPMRALTLTLDYWEFRRRNEITFVDQQLLIDNEDSTDPLYAGRVHRLPADTDSVPGQSIPGRIATVDQLYMNRGRTEVRGVDVGAKATLPLPGTAPLRIALNATYVDRFRVRNTDDQPWIVMTGSLGNPRVRGTLTFGWSPGAWDLNAAVNHVGGFRATNAQQDCTGNAFLGVCDIASYTTLDLGAAYHWTKALTLRGNLINAADTRMPFTPTMPLGNRNWYSPAGRLLSVAASYEF
ncbi:TonB-dependent receptor [Roseateles sp.]|uniref:TonB-dependent receptor plug domain-containing protein n=1 Tax=Roseateles sp. TaxID=1971397 RepID=UPI0031D2AC0C